MDNNKRGELDTVLALLNAEVAAAVKKRTDWMDAHMADYADVQVGEELYELATGRLMGIVSRLYRYWGTDRNGMVRDPQYDTSMSVEYEFQPDPSKPYFDNTSRYLGGHIYGPKDQVFKKYPNPYADQPLKSEDNEQH